MDTDITIALISLAGTFGGTLSGIFVSSKMTNYRLQQLEAKVDKHNNFAEKIPVIQEQLKTAGHRIGNLERRCEQEKRS